MNYPTFLIMMGSIVVGYQGSLTAAGTDEEMGRRFGRFMGSFMEQVDRDRAAQPPGSDPAGAARERPPVMISPFPTYDPWGAAAWGGVPAAPYRPESPPWWEDSTGPLSWSNNGARWGRYAPGGGYYPYYRDYGYRHYGNGYNPYYRDYGHEYRMDDYYPRREMGGRSSPSRRNPFDWGFAPWDWWESNPW